MKLSDIGTIDQPNNGKYADETRPRNFAVIYLIKARRGFRPQDQPSFITPAWEEQQ
jgi:hypothetical protein